MNRSLRALPLLSPMRSAQIGRSSTLWPISCNSAISGRLAASVFQLLLQRLDRMMPGQRFGSGKSRQERRSLVQLRNPVTNLLEPIVSVRATHLSDINRGLLGRTRRIDRRRRLILLHFLKEKFGTVCSNALFEKRAANRLGSVCLAAISLHCSENLGRSPHPVSFQFKSNLPAEPLSKRLYSAKISRALWLVKFSG